MKRRLTLTLCAFGVATAQAISVTWSSLSGDPLPLANTTTSQTAILSDTSAYPGMSVALVLTPMAAAKGGKGNLAEFSGDGLEETKAFRFDGGCIRCATNGTEMGGGRYNFTAGETVALFLVFDGTSVTYYVNGLQLHALAQAMPTSLSAAIWNNTDYLTDVSMAVYDDALTAEQMKKIAAEKNVNAVPEPTALALLALGVAGLALRRRIA